MFIDSRINIIVIFYVNDVLITSFNRNNIQRIKKTLNAKFYIINLRSYAYYLRITITRDRINRIIRLE